MTLTTDPRSGAIAMLRATARRHLPSLASFGLVGGLAFVVDLLVYNGLRLTVFDASPIWAKVASVTVATAVAWVGNRYLTFRRERHGSAVREGALFALMNLIGLCIAAGCLWVSHYVLGFTSPLADNIAGNGVGLVLGTAFRYAAYSFVVFAAPPRRRPRVSLRSSVTTASISVIPSAHPDV